MTEEEVVFAIEKHTSFIVDSFVDTKERSGVSEAFAVHEVDRRLVLEHESVDLIWINASGLAFLLLDKYWGYGLSFRSQ